MALLLNSFAVEIAPLQASLPYIDYATWEDSTSAKDSEFPSFSTWRYEKDDSDAEPEKPCRLVFLNGPATPPPSQTVPFDLGRFWRIGCLLIGNSFGAHFASLGFTIEETGFERRALRRYPTPPDEPIELATGVSFAVRRPFKDEPSKFTISFQWIVRATFKETLESDSLAAIAFGMPVLYTPRSQTQKELSQFENGYIGRVRSIEPKSKTAAVNCRDGMPRTLPLRDLRLEASPALIKIYERHYQIKPGPSTVIRTMQQLRLSLTKDNRRNLTASRDRLERIRNLLYESGSSRDQFVIPIASFQEGSISMDLAPMEASIGEPW